MKVRKTFLTLAIVGLMTALLCFSGPVLAKGPNSGVPPEGTKLVGPLLQGVLILGWRPILNGLGIETGYGDVEAFLYLKDKLYYSLYTTDNPDTGTDGFLATTAADITGGNLPCEIVEDFGIGTCEGTEEAVIWEEKDVSKFVLVEEVEALGVLGAQTYKHILSCEVKISFLIPKSKK